MSKAARKYTEQTVRILFGLSHNQCAFPNCNKELVNRNNAKDSNICHIEAANETGERYNPEMTDKERADYPNLIALCIQHHDETDDVEKYTVEVLKQMKSDHEMNMMQQSKIKDPLRNRPSVLVKVINQISIIDIESFDEIEVKNAFNTEDKIKYNNVIRYKAFFYEYKVYQGRLNKIYTEIEEQGSFKKDSLLKNIKYLYVSAKGKLLHNNLSIENIRKNADNLIEEVENNLYNRVYNSSNTDNEMDIETIIYTIQIILVDAFMRCNILEEIK